MFGKESASRPQPSLQHLLLIPPRRKSPLSLSPFPFVRSSLFTLCLFLRRSPIRQARTRKPVCFEWNKLPLLPLSLFFFEDLPSRTKCKVKCFEREAEARNTELLLVRSLSRSLRHNLNFYFLRVFCILNFPPPFHPSFSIPATFECFIFSFLGVQMILSFLFFIFTCPRGGVGGICFCVRALSVRFTSLRTCSP